MTTMGEECNITLNIEKESTLLCQDFFLYITNLDIMVNNYKQGFLITDQTTLYRTYSQSIDTLLQYLTYNNHNIANNCTTHILINILDSLYQQFADSNDTSLCQSDFVLVC